MKRKGLSQKTRFEVFKRDSFRCQYCGKSSPSVILEVDHIHPVAKGGSETDILNLITSSEECNAGKGDRLIADGSALERQVLQLREINERREQLELLLTWKEELTNLSEITLSAVVNAWNHEVHPWELSETGKKSLQKLITKYGAEKLLNAIQSSCSTYIKRDKKGVATKKSVKNAFDKITLFLKMNTLSDHRREFFYIRGILRNRLSYYSDYHHCYSMELMEDAYAAGIPIEDIKNLATSVKNWSEFSLSIEDWIEKQ